MRYNGILVQGYCREELQEQMSLVKLSEDKYMHGQKFLEERRKNFCVDITFLLTYTLLEKEEFFLWMDSVENHKKESWRTLYQISEYNNKKYEAFFDMRAGAEVDWLTGMLVKIKQGGQKEYWELMNGIAVMYPWERRYIQRRNVVKIEELLKVIKKEKNEVLKAGKLMLLLIIAEFYHKGITRNDVWNRLETVLFRGLEVYQKSQWSVRPQKSTKLKELIEENFMKYGIHAVRLKKYIPAAKEIPRLEREIEEGDWVYLWQMMYAMEECLKENKEIYKQLKLKIEKNAKFDEEKENITKILYKTKGKFLYN